MEQEDSHMDAKVLGANIAKYRRAAGMTQEAVADKCGLTGAYLRQIELGFKVPRLETFLKIAEALNVSADLLLAGNLSTAYTTRSTELSEKISALTPDKQAFILDAIQMLTEGVKRF